MVLFTFEISELVRDYIENTFDGDYTNSAKWVNYQVTRYYSSLTQDTTATTTLAVFDGYGYFEDGSNPQNCSNSLQSNKTIFTNDSD